jgi:hypothetical protein
VKAGLPSDHIGQQTLGSVACEAVVAYFGSVKAAALTMSVDPSLMQRELKACDLRRVHALRDAKLNAAISQAWMDAFGALLTPKQYASRLIDRMQEELNEIRQFIEEVA